ncbi:MAG: hypothetical protein ACP5PZ_11635 [Bacteroidales bacterium]
MEVSNKTNQRIGEATPQQIAQWKAEHKVVKEVEVDGHVCYLRLPDRKILGMASSLGTDPVKFNELLLNNCWLGGSEAIKTDDQLFFGVSQVLAELVTFKAATIKNL